MIAEKLGSVRSPKADGAVYWCRGLAIFEVPKFTGQVSVLDALIVWISEADDREKQKHYRAWELINSACGSTGDGGRHDALRDLNEDYADLSAAPLAKTYLAGVQLPEAGLIWADLAWTKSTGAKFCQTTMPDGSKLTSIAPWTGKESPWCVLWDGSAQVPQTLTPAPTVWKTLSLRALHVPARRAG